MESHHSYLILFQIQSNPMANNGIQALLSYHALIGMSLPSFVVVIFVTVHITDFFSSGVLLPAPLNLIPSLNWTGSTTIFVSSTKLTQSSLMFLT